MYQVHIDADAPATPGAGGTGTRASANNGVTLFLDEAAATVHGNTKYGSLKTATSVKNGAVSTSSTPNSRPAGEPMRLGDIPNQGSTYSTQSSKGSKTASTTPVKVPTTPKY